MTTGLYLGHQSLETISGIFTPHPFAQVFLAWQFSLSIVAKRKMMEMEL